MIRIGYGWDSHEFKKGIPLRIGGVTLPHDKGLAGHSDGDVLLHALTDALLGAVAAGDIGTFFPPTDKRWKGADSALFLRAALQQIRKAGFHVVNVDSTLILDEPKIGPHALTIRQHMAELLKLDEEEISVKAKTPEGLGTEKAAIAHVVVLLEKRSGRERRLRSEAAEPRPEQMDTVVEKLVKSASSHRKGAHVKN
jgi:2-C-methyl-D-erythritol 2,4-cyclodiphosphate synthase